MIKFGFLLIGRGIRIRTLNDGVRVRSVTVTLYLYIIFVFSIITYKTHLSRENLIYCKIYCRFTIDVIQKEKRSDETKNLVIQ